MQSFAARGMVAAGLAIAILLVTTAAFGLLCWALQT